MVRKDLEKARLLIDLVRRRERQKLKYYRMLNSFFEYAVFPLSHLLKPILQKCKRLDYLIPLNLILLVLINMNSLLGLLMKVRFPIILPS